MPAPARSRAAGGTIAADEAESFRGQMLTEMARMSLDDGLVMQIHPGSFRNHNPRVHARFRSRQGRRHPDAHRLRRRTEAAARPLRQRARFHADPVHARRDDLCARAGAARRPLPGAEARPAVVVPRQLRGHAALPRAGDRDGGLLQHRRLQRRHPRLPVDSRAPRRLRGASTAASLRPASSSTASARTKLSSWHRCWRETWPRPHTGCSIRPTRHAAVPTPPVGSG